MAADEYCTENVPGRVDRLLELNLISMRKNDNPKTLFSQITAIERKWRARGVSDLTELDKKVIVYCNAPRRYAETLVTCRAVYGDPSLKELRSWMYDSYRMSQIRSTAGRDDADSEDSGTMETGARRDATRVARKDTSGETV
eukprot:jgi/Psemu1/70134/estExt_Genemark1.C_14500006